MRYTLDDGEAIHREAPETFWIPEAAERNALRPGQIVKLIFRIEFDGEVHVERMWVQVKGRNPEGYIGELDNDAYCTTELLSGRPFRALPRDQHLYGARRCLTCLSTRTPCGVRALRALLAQVAGYFHVIPHWIVRAAPRRERRWKRLRSTALSVNGIRARKTAGNVCRLVARPGTRSGLGPSVPVAASNGRARNVSSAGCTLHTKLGTTIASQPLAKKSKRENWRSMLDNLSIDTDPQQQEAASPLMLVVRSFLR